MKKQFLLASILGSSILLSPLAAGANEAGVESARVQRGIGAHLLEIEMWRLVAQELTAEPKMPARNQPGFELAHIQDQHDSGSWQLLRTID